MFDECLKFVIKHFLVEIRRIIMAQKRNAAEIFEGDILESVKQQKVDYVKKHTLDSEEEDSGEDETFV